MDNSKFPKCLLVLVIHEIITVSLDINDKMENHPRLKNPHLNSISVYNTQKYLACSRL